MNNSFNHNKCRWLSKGFEHLVSKIEGDKPDIVFDIVIIGSGYGGAISAAELSNFCNHNGEQLKICILERGKEYLPGMFPRRFADLPGHVRFNTNDDGIPKGVREGLFDIRLNEDLNIVLANGLGGGSLINAGVMEQPKQSVFNDGWPDEIRNFSTDNWNSLFQETKQLLGASHQSGSENTIFNHPQYSEKQKPDKFRVLEQLASTAIPTGDSPIKPASLSIAMEDKVNSAGVKLDPCLLCGDCATGCNHNAKESLDTNLLAKAKKNGVEIYTGATVYDIEKNGNSWIINTGYTDEKLQSRQGAAIKIGARRVILAAGSLGSTEILKRSSKLDLSKKLLGERFSSNGDMIAAGYHQEQENIDSRTSAVANENDEPQNRNIGPTITGLIDLRNTKEGFSIEDMAVPGPLRRLFEEIFTTTDLLHSLNAEDKEQHLYGHPKDDPLAVSDQKINKTSVYAIMGDDKADGKLILKNGGSDSNALSDGFVKVNWKELRDRDVFKKQIMLLRRMTEDSKLGGRVLPNPSWSPLPENLNSFLDEGNNLGPLLTVHPLGGCPMGNNAGSGVVNHLGQVFFNNAKESSEVHDGLVVLDGSIVPTSLGINPALTIATLSLRAVRKLQTIWKLEKAPKTQQKLPKRPRFREDLSPQPVKPTEIEVTERLSGEIALPIKNGKTEKRLVEITLNFKKKDVLDLVHPSPDNKNNSLSNARLIVDPKNSKIRIFRVCAWNEANNTPDSNDEDAYLGLEERLDIAADFIANLEGQLTLFTREESSSFFRKCKSGWAWALNRGLRDIWPNDAGSISKLNISQITRLIKSTCTLASHAGEVRLLEYNLKLKDISKTPGYWSDQNCSDIRGLKRFTYARKSNPIKQLMEVDIVEFFGERKKSFGTLGLDTSYLTRLGIPLFQLARQEDLPTAIADLASLAGFVIRMMISIHLLTFRKPDAANADRDLEGNSMPGKIDGLPLPEHHEIEVQRDFNCDSMVTIHLTHYPRKKSTKPPILLVHGYTTSGITFAHNVLKPNLVSYLWSRDRDVWVVELRNSPALSTAQDPWTFDQIAKLDIPAAINHILNETKKQKIDVVAHCIGAAMFSMAILSSNQAKDEKLLKDKINRVVLSQISPFVVFSPGNIFRSYLFRYFRHFLPKSKYLYRAGKNPSGLQNLLNRILSALPYPEGEFDLENPITPWKKTPFVELRHRMDALYGRAFSLKNISTEVLDRIDDLFGPPNIDSISQTIHFARQNLITNNKGLNVYVSRKSLKESWTFPTLSIHGSENGLTDVSTLNRSKVFFKDSNINYKTKEFKGFGHQDSFIGKNSEEIFKAIEDFLSDNDNTPEREANTEEFNWIATTPHSGPLTFTGRGPQEEYFYISLGSSPTYGIPLSVVFMNVKLENGEYHLADRGQPQNIKPKGHKLYVTMPEGIEVAPNWMTFKIRKDFINSDATGILAITIYDQLYQLEDFKFFTPPNDNLMDEDEDETTIDKELLKRLQKIPHKITTLLNSKPATELEPGIIYPPKEHIGKSNQMKFLMGSCQYPAGFIDNKLAYSSYQRMEVVIKNHNPELLLLVGDQVYIDATAGLFDPSNFDDRYRLPYEKLISNSIVGSVFRRLPVYTVPDDHEIHDNWEPGNPEQNGLSNTKQREFGTYNFINYFSSFDNGTWGAITDRSFSFFLLDTRTQRDSNIIRNARNIDHAKIIDDAQHDALESWLIQEDSNYPKFIVSSSALLPRHAIASPSAPDALRSDGWDGYPHSFNRLLQFLVDHRIENVVFLSGDEHLSSVTHAKIENESGDSTVIHSVHSSGLYSPLPFANSQREDLLGDDEFSFSQNYRCSVKTRFFPGDGFALLDAHQKEGRWLMKCVFNRDNDPIASKEEDFVIGAY